MQEKADSAAPASAPRTVAWLGYGGLLPFVVLAGASVIDALHGALWQRMLLNYGAVILSFVGALHWGVAMSLPALSARKRQVCFIWSVIPALLGWLALALGHGAGSALLVLGFAAHYLQDWRLLRDAGVPGWYLPLRRRLSVVAVLSLLASNLAGLV
ncbi:DUF3429 domain-containing protein [Janthinobacterium sp. RB2R34]|uniref:DUF3429 domain-containing protein n=1 Tax=Janthinobacterium sp. RB2R34 TaxID=3424193 RepID=UPI003F22B26C